MNIRILKTTVAGLILLASTFANAGLISDWTISGDGITNAENISLGNWELTYNHDGNFSGNWVLSAMALEAGDFTFDWNYSGHHSWFQSVKRLSAYSNDGTILIASNFSSGIHTFSGLEANEVFGFEIYGSHSDSSKLLRGKLNVSQVPEPSTIAIFALGVIGIASRKFKK